MGDRVLLVQIYQSFISEIDIYLFFSRYCNFVYRQKLYEELVIELKFYLKIMQWMIDF